MNNSDKVKIVLKDGTITDLAIWQKTYGLKEESTQIGKHFDLTEDRFQRDIELYGQVYVNSLLIRVLDQFREDVGRSLKLNALNRNQAHQDELSKEGFRTASISPHLVTIVNGRVTGATAADIDTDNHEQTNREVEILKLSASKLGIKIRIGWKQYQMPSKLAPNGQTFIHVDVCPEFYAKGKCWNKISHPEAWEREARW